MLPDVVVSVSNANGFKSHSCRWVSVNVRGEAVVSGTFFRKLLKSDNPPLSYNR